MMAIYSIDDKVKVQIGILAVSQYVDSRKYFDISNSPITEIKIFPEVTNFYSSFWYDSFLIILI